MTDSTSPTNPYEALGREEGVERLSRRFYELMDTLPEAKTIRAMHKGDLEPMVDKLSTFLVSWMGGPQLYNEKFGRVNIPMAHQPFDIGQAEADAWLLCMQKALDEADLDPRWVEKVMEPMRQMATMCKTRAD